MVWNPLGRIKFDPESMSPFGDLVTAELTPLVQLDFVYGINIQTGLKFAESNGAAIDTNSGRLRLQTGTNAAGSAVFMSRRPAKYRAGQGVIARFTSVFAEGAPGSKQLRGMGNSADGYFFGFNGADFGILHRNKGVDSWVPQELWNGDQCDGVGDSVFTLNPTLGNVYVVRYPYLGYGAITFWVEDSVTGGMILCHTLRYPNSSASTQLGNPNLNYYAENTNAGNTSNLIGYSGSVGAFSCGQRSYVGSPRWAMDSAKSSITTETALLSIKNCTSFNGVVNRSMIRLNSLSASGTANSNAVVLLKIGATLGGVPVYTPISGASADNGATITGGNSITSYDVAGTTVTGGMYQFNINFGPNGTGVLDLTPFELFISPGEIGTASAKSNQSNSIGVSLNWSEDI